MKAISYILRTSSGITDLLTAAPGATKADAIYLGHAVQDQAPPYITVESQVLDNYVVKEQGRSLVKEAYDVYVYTRDFITAKNICEQIEAALDNLTNNTYNGQEVFSCKLLEEDFNDVTEEDGQYWLGMQRYEAVVEIGQVSYTPISAFSYSNNNQTVSGDITAMAATVTGDVNNYEVSDSDTTEWTNGGLSLDTSTGAITGTLAASITNVPIIVNGKDGSRAVALVSHTLQPSNLWTPANLSSGLELWIDFADTDQTTTTAHDGTTVITAVTDKSANSYDATAPANENSPVVTSINGKQAALFMGDDYLSFNVTSAINQEFTVFMSGLFPASHSSSSANNYLAGESILTERIYSLSGLERIFVNFGANATWSATTEESFGFHNVASGITNILEVNANGASSSISLTDDEFGNSGTVNMGTNSMSGVYRIGAYGSGSGGGINGGNCILLDVIIVSGAISASDRDKIQGYLARKARGDTNNLPSAHAYKSVDPTTS